MNRVYPILFLFFCCSIYAQRNIYSIAKNGTVEELKEMTIKDVDCIDKPNDFGFTPLILACYKGNIEVAKYLAINTKDINYQSEEGTALMAAVMNGNLELIQFLIDNKSDVNGVNKYGISSLMLAIQFKKLEVVKLFNCK